MRRGIIWLMVGAPLTLVAVASGTAAAVPTIRHMVSGLWNVPDHLPALPDNKMVHYQPGAEEYAHEVAALLPDAIARVEAAHGRPFAHPVTIGVYATPEAYAAANGLGSAGPVGVTFLGRVNLSPKLFRAQHQRLPAIVTHELSHAHIQTWIGVNAYLRLPNWFKEGLAVMVSGGGGAEMVSEEEARAAIQRGERIAIDEAGSLQHIAEVRFETAPAKASTSWYPVVLAYREAGMFVTYLHDSNGPAFAHMMDAILDGHSFVEAVTAGYNESIQSLWNRFAQPGDEKG
jgi:hypothetical protein